MQLDTPPYCFGSPEHRARQASSYTTCIRFIAKPYQDTEDICWLRKVADEILKIGEYIKSNNIPACFPNSRGVNHAGDNSRIVYNDPEHSYIEQPITRG